MSTLTDRLSDVRFNPALMKQVMLDQLEAQVEGLGDYDVPDPSSPFVWLMESGVIAGSMFLTEQEALLRRLYPRMAITPEELYLHMADTDYIGRFATPAWTTFEWYLPKAEVMAKAIDTGENGVRKLVIPRLTSFSVADTTFTMQYPIELRVMSHGGLQIVYDTAETSPIQTLATNMVDWDSLRISNAGEILRLKIPVGQFAVKTFNETINKASGFNVDFGFSDQFYVARVYLSNAQGGWDEIRTTHTEQVFDPNELTAVLRVEGNNLNVKLPLVYFTQNLAEGELRVDVYTTKGPISMDLGSYDASQYETYLNDIDDDSTYVSPLKAFNQSQALNPNLVSGGANAVSFERLRDQVINNTLGASQIPITHAQLGTDLQNRGYSVVTNIDNITNRQFLASRRLPAPADGSISGGMGCTMGQIQVSMEQLVGSSHVKDNGERITLLPSMLYEYQNGTIQVVNDVTISQLATYTPDALARVVNSRRFLYTPLHYVMDATNDHFDFRPYFLDAPQVNSKVFVGENSSTQMQVSVDTYDLTRIPEGYRLVVKLKSGENFKAVDDEAVYVQLGYQPAGESTYASINGTLVGIEDDERVYQFEILTEYDIDENDRLYTTNFSMYDATQRHFATGLDAVFDISFIVTNQSMALYRFTELDQLVSEHLLPTAFQVIARERLNITLGYALTNLWRRNRTLVSQSSYRRYAVDVPYVYEQTIYKRDEFGQVIIGMDADGNVTYEIEHNKGDPVLDENGEPRYRYRKGDVVLDSQGQPELVGPRKLLREVTLFLMDGVYYFVSDADALAYRGQTPMQLISWLRNDVGLLQQRLLEQSEIYLYPTATLGDTTAIAKEGLQTTISLDQHFYVNYYLTDQAYGNIPLREALVVSTKEIVSELLGRSTVSVSDIIARLKANAGEDVISLEAGGLGGENDFSILSITDDAVRMALRKRLTVLSNQLLAAQDDIDINFLRHTTT